MEDKQIVGFLMMAQFCPDKRKAILATLLDEFPPYINDQQPPGIPGMKWLLEEIFHETCKNCPEFLPCLFPIFSLALRHNPCANTKPVITWQAIRKMVQFTPWYNPSAQKETPENTEQIAMDEYHESPPTDYQDIGGGG